MLVTDPAEKRRIGSLLSASVPRQTRTDARRTAMKNNVITMVGVECRGAIVVGAARECLGDIGEINYPSGEVRSYYMHMLTAGVQLGGALDVVWTTIEAGAPELNLFKGEGAEYDSFVGGVSAHAGQRRVMPGVKAASVGGAVKAGDEDICHRRNQWLHRHACRKAVSC